MSPIVLLLVTVLASAAPAGATGTAGRASLDAVGGFVALSVPNAETTAQWYEQKLGLNVVLRPLTTPDFQVIVLEGRGWMIELLQRRDARPLSEIAPQITARDQIHGVFKAGVLVENLDKAVAFLQLKGVPIAFGPYPAQNGNRANLIIRDLDGNLIQFIQR